MQNKMTNLKSSTRTKNHKLAGLHPVWNYFECCNGKTTNIVLHKWHVCFEWTTGEIIWKSIVLYFSWLKFSHVNFDETLLIMLFVFHPSHNMSQKKSMHHIYIHNIAEPIEKVMIAFHSGYTIIVSSGLHIRCNLIGVKSIKHRI